LPEGERGGGRVLKHTVCDACSAYQPTRRERRAVLSFAIWQPIWLAALLAYSQADPSLAFGPAILMLGAVLSLPLAIAAHETGHALAAALVGRHVVEVVVGSGPAVARLRIAGVDATFRRYPIGGMARSFADTDARSRWRDAVVLAAGAVANAALGLAAFLAVTRLAIPENGLGIALSSLLTAIALVNAGMGGINLLPWKVGGVVPSDGWRLLNLAAPETALAADNRQLWRIICLTELGRFERVEAESAAGARSSHFAPVLVGLAMNAISKRRGNAAAMDWYLAEGFHPDTLAPFSQGADVARSRAFLKASVAWDALKSCRPELRELADDLSRQACETLPETSAIRGIRGAVLCHCGATPDGLGMVLDAARSATGDEEKADFCDVLASRLRQSGQDQRARGFAAVSRRLRDKMAAQYR
jgi:hypothetical protein